MINIIIRPAIHYGLHFIFPLVIAFIFYKNFKWKAYFILVATIIIDLDHLMASPIFDPNRCSIGLHPLHTWYAFAVYISMLYFPKLRLVAIGLVLHFVADFIDCLFISAN